MSVSSFVARVTVTVATGAKTVGSRSAAAMSAAASKSSSRFREDEEKSSVSDATKTRASATSASGSAPLSPRASAFFFGREGNRWVTMLFSWSGMKPEGVQDRSATNGSGAGSGGSVSARVSAEGDSVRDASVTVARRDEVSGVGGAKRHRGGDAPSHVPSSRRRIPPRLLGSDTEARATPALESRDAGPAGRLVVRRRWRASVSRHPRPSAWRWRGNARDAIARALSFSPARSRERGSARVCTALASRTHCARTQSRELRARGQLCSKMRDATSEEGRGGNVVSRKRQFTQNSTVREPERAFRGRTISRRDFACGASVRGGTAGEEIFFSPLT